MKQLVVLFFGLFFWVQSVAAFPSAAATFFSNRGETFQFVFDGRFVNRSGTNVVRLFNIPAGYHTAEFRIPGHRGIFVHRTQVFMEPNRQSEFMLQVMGYNRQMVVRKVAERPLRRVYPNQLPSLPRYPTQEPYGGDYSRDDDNRYANNNHYEEPESTVNAEQCRDILEKPQVDRLLQSMAAKNQESSKESIARQALSQNSVLAEDLKIILEQFQYENTRLSFAKFAYSATCDRRNFYVVNEAFTYDASIRELEDFITQR